MQWYITSLGRKSALLLRMMLGLFFIVSAVAKLVDMDRFELYVFSFQLFSLNASMLLARLLVVVELLVGVGLMSNICHRWVNSCTVMLLTAFSLFLGYSILIGRDDSCQCMGAWVDISPSASLLKNALLLLLMVPASHSMPWSLRPHWYVWLLALAAPFLLVFIYSAPDNWLFHSDDVSHNKEPLPFLCDENLAQLHLDSGRHVLLFLSPECRYCRMADQKMTTIRRRHHIDSTLIHYIVPSQEGSAVQNPFAMPVTGLPDSTFLHYTGGMRPLVLLLTDGHLVAVYHYRNMGEVQLAEFFK